MRSLTVLVYTRDVIQLSVFLGDLKIEDPRARNLFLLKARAFCDLVTLRKIPRVRVSFNGFLFTMKTCPAGMNKVN